MDFKMNYSGHATLFGLAEDIGFYRDAGGDADQVGRGRPARGLVCFCFQVRGSIPRQS